MQIDIRHYGFVKNGIKTYYNPELYRDQLAALEGREFCEIIKQKHKKPSNNLHGYYRGGILGTCYQTEMFSHLDNKDQIHELYFAPKYLSYVKLVEIKGVKKEVTITRSLADLTESEMIDFVNRVKFDCEENGIEIGDPADYYSKFYNK